MPSEEIALHYRNDTNGIQLQYCSVPPKTKKILIQYHMYRPMMKENTFGLLVADIQCMHKSMCQSKATDGSVRVQLFQVS